MVNTSINAKEIALIDSLVDEYQSNERQITTFLTTLTTFIADDVELNKHVHTIKTRIKDPAHLRDKLERKIIKAKSEGTEFNINKDNLLTTVNDLAGIRILHLYSGQMQKIAPLLMNIFDENRLTVVEGPEARTWDDESSQFFESIGIGVTRSDTLYTSVHYVIGSASRVQMTCEIQVRTLSEEIWGEVDHELNYPHKTKSLACSEQLKVLARVTSSATRLVDSIFRSHDEFNSERSPPIKKASRKKKNRN